MTRKEKTIERINKLGWGNILYGYDKEGNLININFYDEEKDLFGGYGENMKYTYYTFEELPLDLIRA